jgi:uncharacterized membrane protein
MKEFLKGIFSEDGTPSSKRVVMFLLTLLFVFISLVNLFTGKNLSEILQNQLFYLLCWSFSIVLGGNLIQAIKGKSDDQTKQP